MDPVPPSRRLSEISHLFLSDVRKKQTGQDAPPTRVPPQPVAAARVPAGEIPPGGYRRDLSVDLTSEEFARVFRPDAAATPPAAFKPARVVIAHHLGEAMADRVRDLAAAIAGDGRVGVVYADDGSVRVSCVEAIHAGVQSDEPDEAPGPEAFDPQRLREVLVELDQDVSQWVVVLADVRSTDAKALLGKAADWTLLSGVDHDGIVAAYRTLKGCCDGRSEAARPRLSISVLGADGDANNATGQEADDEAGPTFRKLAGVCEQFLKVTVTAGPTAHAVDAAEHGLLDAIVDAPTHWAVLADLLGGTHPVDAALDAEASVATTPFMTTATAVATPPATPPVARPVVLPVVLPVTSPVSSPVASPIPEASLCASAIGSAHVAVEPPASRPAVPVMKLASVSAAPADEGDAVLDLPDADASPAGILRAVVRGGGDWIESPLSPPSLPEAKVAVSRDRRLTLLAVARPGLVELRSIGVALRWLVDNRALITMALPQLSIDPTATPRLHLLVDHVDATADALQPLLAAGSVTVAAYRRVRWAGRAGLLLEAA